MTIHIIHVVFHQFYNRKRNELNIGIFSNIQISHWYVIYGCGTRRLSYEEKEGWMKINKKERVQPFFFYAFLMFLPAS
jgi:hypothetical protein